MLNSIIVFAFLGRCCAAVQFQKNKIVDEISFPPISHTNKNFEKSGFSAHHCVGGNDYAGGASERSCVFFNVCHLEGEDDIIHYYVDPSKLRKPVYSEGSGVQYSFAPNLVYRGAYSYPIGKGTPGEDEGDKHYIFSNRYYYLYTLLLPLISVISSISLLTLSRYMGANHRSPQITKKIFIREIRIQHIFSRICRNKFWRVCQPFAHSLHITVASWVCAQHKYDAFGWGLSCK
jgi:hypothetical protein